jgi:hypothetical protein
MAWEAIVLPLNYTRILELYLMRDSIDCFLCGVKFGQDPQESPEQSLSAFRPTGKSLLNFHQFSLQPEKWEGIA